MGKTLGIILVGNFNLLAMGTTFTGSGNLYCQWELSPGSGNALYILFPTDRFPLSLSRSVPTESSAKAVRVIQESFKYHKLILMVPRRPNGEALRKCILSGPDKQTTVLVQAVDAVDDSPAIPEHMTVETPTNMSLENKAYFESEKEAIHLILTGIGDEIYSTVDACQTAQGMWEAIERLQQGESLNIQDVKTNLFWEFAIMVKEVNELRAKRLAMNANPLALVATAQANQDPYHQTSKSQKSYAPSSKPIIPTRSHTTTRHKGNEIAKPITPPFETASEEDSDPEQAQSDEDMQKNLALIAKTVNVAGAWANVGSLVVQQSGIQYTDEEVNEQELEAHYSYMAKIQEVPTAESGIDSEPVEQVQNNVGYNVFANDLQHSEQSESNEQNDIESDDERVALANLIANLKLDVDENKKIHKQLKKANTTLAQELKECKAILAETNQFGAPTAQNMEILIQTCVIALATKTRNDSFRFVHELKQEMHVDLKYVEFLEKETDDLESDKVEFSNMYDVILQECVSNDVKCSYLQSLSDLDALDELQCLYLHKVKECDCLAQKLSNQTESVSKEVHSELLKCFAKVEKHLISLEIALQKHKEQIVQLILFIVDSGCTKHMTCNLKLLCNFVEKFHGTVRFGNDQFATVLGYGDLVRGNVMINGVYYIEGLNHNLFSVGQFCNADLEVAFRKSTCFVRDLQGNDLLTGNCGSDLYTIYLQESTSSTPLCLMAKASPTQAWLWHRRLSYLNFDYINLLSKKDIVIGLPKLKYVKDQLCSSCELSKAKRSSFKSKAIPSSKGRLNLLHMDLCGPIGTEFLNKTLNAFFKEKGIEHQTSTARTPKQNGVVKRRNHTLVEAARTMLSALKHHLFFWAEAIATACYTQNQSIIIPMHDKTPYHIINDRKPSIKHLHIFGCTCYITRDGENLDKMKEKRDPCILASFLNDKRHQIMTTLTVPQQQDVSSSADVHVPSQQEFDLLFGPLYDEFFNAGSNPQDKQPTTNIQSTSASSTPTYVHAEENTNDQAKEGEHLQDDEFTNLIYVKSYIIFLSKLTQM
nr:retrovirus-related Pol polyprotein from transposon TNT 1-94 [Tanacetum cinerariifolium]